MQVRVGHKLVSLGTNFESFEKGKLSAVAVLHMRWEQYLRLRYDLLLLCSST